MKQNRLSYKFITSDMDHVVSTVYCKFSSGEMQHYVVEIQTIINTISRRSIFSFFLILLKNDHDNL